MLVVLVDEVFELDAEPENACEGTDGALELTEFRFESIGESGESPNLLTTGGVKDLGRSAALSGEGAPEARLKNWPC